jgi:hypothetical protein
VIELTEEQPTPTPPPEEPKSPDTRPQEIQKKHRNVRLMWGCRDKEHDKILLFENHNEAQLHANETGHKIEFFRYEL